MKNILRLQEIDPMLALAPAGRGRWRPAVGLALAALLAASGCQKVADASLAPIADAGIGRTALVGTTVTLDGTKSHVGGGDSQTGLVFEWSLLTQPAGSTATLSGADTAQPTVLIDAVGDFIFRLVVKAAGVESRPAAVMIRGYNALSVTSQTPQEGAYGVQPMTPIVITFSEAVQPETVKPSTFFAEVGSNVISGRVEVDAGNTLAAFWPLEAYPAGQQVTVIVTQGVVALSGLTLPANYQGHFTVATGPDLIPPQVTEIIPPDRAADVPASTSVTVAFDESMDPATLTLDSSGDGCPDNVQLLDARGDCVAGTIEVLAGNTRVVYTPVVGLNPGDGYRVVVVGGPGGVTDASGVPMVDDVTTTFTVTTDLDVTPPYVVSIYPGPSYEDVPLGATIMIDFSEPLWIDTVNAASIRLSDGTTDLSGTYSLSFGNSVVTFALDAPLTIATNYTVTVVGDGINAVADVSGVALDGDRDGESGGDFVSHFRTAGTQNYDGIFTLPESIGPGEDIPVLLTDRDLDVSVLQDTVTIEAQSSTGEIEEIVLTETDVTSGAFDGMIGTRYAAGPGPSGDGLIDVLSGDEIVFMYNDQMSAAGVARLVTATVQVAESQAAITVSAPSGNTSEAGGTATISIVLNNQPIGDVTLTFDTDDTTEGVPSVTTLLFTATNWNAPQIVTLTGVDDSIADGNQTYHLVFQPTVSTDGSYSGIAPASVTLTNIDNETAGFTVSPVSGPTTEAGGTAWFTVVLNSRPAADVTVHFNTDDATEGTPSSTALTFTSVNWNAPQTVTVTGVDDNQADGNVTYGIHFAATTSGDSAYAAITPTDVSIINIDNESAGFLVSPISGNTSESGGTASFSLALTSAPSGDVTVNLTSSDVSEGLPNTTSLLFTAVNWNSPQFVTVTGADDFVQDGLQPYFIRFGATTSTDADYAAIKPSDVAVFNIDNDSASILVSAISRNTNEGGGTGTFTVVLNSQPTASVTITFRSSDTTEGTPSVTALTFTPASWAGVQTVTVTGVNDAVADGNQPYSINFDLTQSADAAYNNLALASISVFNIDNDSAGYTIDATVDTTTGENGDTAFFSVMLNSQPTASVTVRFNTNDSTEGIPSVTSLVFTTADYASPKLVTVTGQNDAVQDGSPNYFIVFQASLSADSKYQGTPAPNVQLVNIDDDTAGYAIIASDVTTDEAGDTGTFSVRLNSEPTANVTVRFNTNDATEGIPGVTSLVFTTVDWASPKVVTVTGQNDAVQDGSPSYQIVFQASQSADTNYTSTPGPNITFTNTDNDTAGYTIVTPDLITDEGGGTASFTVRLNSEPTASVTVRFNTNDATEGLPGVTSLVFTTADWASPKSVTVTGQDDAVQDGSPNYTIVFQASLSADTNYQSTPAPNIILSNTDNDTAGYTIIAADVITDEGGGTGSFTVRLNSEPTANVTVRFNTNDSTEGIPSVTSLVFTTADWASPKSVTVTGQNDAVQDGSPNYQIVFQASQSADTNYQGTPAPNITFTNTDNDTAGYTIVATDVITNEAGDTGSFSVKLNSEPTATVTVRFNTNDSTEGIPSVTSLVFTTADWASPKVVTVTGQNDAVQDGSPNYTIVFQTSQSADTNYQGTPTPNIVLTNTDDDTAGYTVAATDVLTDEFGGTGSFSVRLNSEPTAAVTVRFNTNDSTEGIPSVTSLVFTTADWASPKVVTVTGQDDAVQDGSPTYSIVFQSSNSADTNYGGTTPAPSITLTNTDNDTAGYTVTATDVLTDEFGGTGSFNVRLNSQPTANVTVRFNTDDSTEGTPSVTSLVFTTADWASPKVVTVTGQDDAVQDGSPTYNIVFQTSQSTDTNYQGTPTPNIALTNTDNDTAGYTIVSPDVITDEGGDTGTFSVRLNSQPTANVTVRFNTNDSTEGIPGVTSLVFTTADWASPKNVTVTGQNDAVQDGSPNYQIVFQASQSTDTNYQGTPAPNITFTNTDNDTAGYTILASDVITDEGGDTGTFSVKLNSEPTASVTVRFNTNDSTEGIPSVTSLVFTTADWASPKVVTVTGQNDAVQDGSPNYQIVFQASQSADTNYQGTPAPNITLTNTDNDTAGYTIATPDLVTDETGGTGTFSIRLNSEPTANVTVRFNTNDATEGVPGVTSLVFTTADWASPKAVTVTGQDDFVMDGNATFQIVFQTSLSADTNYLAAPNPNIGFTNTDNDTAGYTVVASDVITDEGGDTGTFTVRLNTQPTANVTVRFNTNDSTEGIPGVTSLVFTTADWAAPKAVTVTGQNDAVQDGSPNYQIQFQASQSADGNYVSTPTPNITFTNTDNDTAGYTILSPDVITDEGGDTGTFSVKLNSEPTASVTVRFNTNDSTEGIPSVTSLVFTTADWASPKVVTVTGQNDAVQDGSPNYSIVFQASLSADVNYQGTPTPNIVFTNTDNDTAGYTIVASDVTTDEFGDTGTFTVKLNSEPTANVTVRFNTNDATEGTPSVTSLVFTTADWASPKSVLVTGQDDFVQDGSPNYQIVFQSSQSADTNYQGTPAPNITLTNTDNDTAGYTINSPDVVTDEGGDTGTFSVRLNSQPTANVTVRFNTNDSTEGIPGVTSLVFTTADWASPKNVTVTGQNDAVQDGSPNYQIVFQASQSTDTNYQGTPVPNITFTNTDNDTAGYTIVASDVITDEGGDTGTFSVKLNSEPTANVTVRFNTNDSTEGIPSVTSLVFTTADWASPKVVTVTGQNDAVQDGSPNYQIVFQASQSADTNYQGTPAPNITLTNTDNDTAGYTVVASDVTTDEFGATGQFTVKLNSEPTANVTVRFNTNDATEGVPSVTSLVFTTADWASPKSVTVTGQDDFVQDGSPNYQIVFQTSQSADTNYQGTPAPNITLTNTDNDTAGYTLNSPDVFTDEFGDTGTFNIKLNTQPTANVTIRFNTNDSTEGVPSVTSLVFTTVDWGSPKSVTVTGQDDAVQDGSPNYLIVFQVSQSTDTNYQTTPGPSIMFTNTDNDTAGYTIVASDVLTDEGGDTGSFSVRLNSEPTANVTVRFNTNDSTEGIPSVTSLVFTTVDWASPKVVTVTGQNDAVQDGSPNYQIVFQASQSTDTNYQGTPTPNITLTNTDNDTAGYTVVAVDVLTDEGGDTGSFTVKLNSEPAANVTVRFNTNDATEGIPSVTSLVFTTADYASPKSVTVTGQNDAVQDGSPNYQIIFQTSQSADTNYQGTPTPNITFTNTDNDTAGYTIVAPDVLTDEGGDTGSFNIKLNSEPTASVTVRFNTDDSTEGIPSVTSLVFTTLDWASPKSVTVTGQNDAVQDGSPNYHIVFQASLSADTNYQGTPTPNITLTNTDNDTAGYTIVAVDVITDEGGDTGSFTVELNSQPTANVTVRFNTDDSTEGIPSVTSLVFTTADYASPKSVTVTGQNDAVQDGSPNYHIVFQTSQSADTNYQGTPTPNITLTNTDNDTAGYTIVAVDVVTDEGGDTGSFTVVLNSQPTANVTVRFNTNDSTEGIPSVTSLVFTTADYASPKSVTVTGQNDAVQDGSPNYQIVFQTSQSADTNYQGTPTPNITFSNTDNDTAGYTMTTPDLTTDEGGGTGTFTVKLNSEPTASVTVRFDTNDTTEGIPGVTSLVFTTSDWASPKTVTVTGQDDFVQDGSPNYQIVFQASQSADSNYQGTPAPNITFTNTDNDTAGYTMTTPDLVTDETGDTGTFTVKLNSQPTSVVTVRFNTSDTTEGVPGVTSLVFTTADWASPKSVTVTGQDDFVQDGSPNYQIVFQSSQSTDTNYQGTPAPNITFSNTDNDTAGYTMTTPDLITDEGGGTGSFTVKLNSQPTGNVTVRFDTNDSTEGVPGVTSLVFTTADWGSPKSVTVTGQDDLVQDGSPNYQIVFQSSQSTDTNYQGTPAPNITFSNTDNDTAGYTIVATDVITDEGGDTGSFNVKLNSQPTGNVTVRFNTNDSTEGIPSVTSLVFTTADFASPKVVTVTGQNDAVQDGSPTYQIVFQASQSTDTNYQGTPAPNITLTNTDNDTAGYTVVAVDVLTDEGGDTGSFTVKLNSEPTANVTVRFNTNDATEGIPSVTSLVFTTADYASPKSVTVTGQNDAVQDGSPTYQIQFQTSQSADTNYQGTPTPNITLTNTDNDTAGYTVVAVDVLTDEGGDTGSFTVKLNSEPTANVTVRFNTNDATEGVPSVTSLVFTTVDWGSPKSVTVTGQDDPVQDGSPNYQIVFQTSQSTDTNYQGTPTPNITLTNTDNDTAGYTVVAVDVLTDEGGDTGSFTVKLNSEPTYNVTVRFNTDDSTEGIPSVTSLVFTTADYASPQSVTVTGQNDAVQDGSPNYHIVFQTSQSTDTNYQGTPTPNITLTNTDNDTAGYTVVSVDVVTDEGGDTGSFTVKLNSQPTYNVTVRFNTDDTSEGIPGVTSLIFTTSDYASPQTVTVTGQDDAVQDGSPNYHIVFQTSQSTDTNYQGTPTPNITLTNTDNDTAGYTIGTPDVITGEDGATGTFNVKLNSEPTANVVVRFDTNDSTEGIPSVTSLTFTPLDWNTTKSVTVVGQDDLVADGSPNYQIVFQTSQSVDTHYQGTPAPNVTLTNVDNDTAGYTVVAVDVITDEGGDTGSFTVKLNSQPTNNVTVRFNTDDSTEGIPAVTSLVFTAGNYDTAQSVTVTGQDDAVQDGSPNYHIVFQTSQSADTSYQGTPTPNITLTNTDNDTAGYTIVAADVVTGEDGATGSFTVKLNSEPTANVTVRFDTNDSAEGRPAVTSLVFTTANYGTAQSVTVNGIDDAIDDGDQPFNINFQASLSADTHYQGTPSPNIGFTNVDDDASGFTVTPIDTSTSEAGGTGSFSVVLGTQPTFAVTVRFNSSNTNEGTVAVTSLVFLTSNWATAQTVTVTGVNDDIDDDDVSYSIGFLPSASGDPKYNLATPTPDVGMTNVDNDTWGYTVSAPDTTTSEGGATGSFTVHLNSQPTSDVVVRFNSNDLTEGTVSVTSLTFTTVNWITAQGVTVTGVDDVAIDGLVSYKIAFSSSVTADGKYTGTQPADINMSNADNDAASYVVTTVDNSTDEAGATGSFTVVLSSQPTSDVTVRFSTGAADEGTTGAVTSLTFTTSNWSSAQAVTVTGVDDNIIDGPQVYTINFQTSLSLDGNFAGTTPSPNPSLTNTDLDVADYVITPVNTLTSESGDTGSFTITLTSQPTASVTMHFTSNDTTEGTVASTSLVIAAANWNNPQTVTVTGQDDSVIDGTQNYKIQFVASESADLHYNGTYPSSDVNFQNSDDDAPGYVVGAPSGHTTEAGGTATFNVHLSSQPTASVTMHFNTDAPTEGTVGVTSLTFTSALWNVNQQVTVTGVNDDYDDGDTTYHIVFQASESADGNFNGTQPSSSVTMVNDDNDTFGYTINVTDATTSEDLTNGEFTVKLKSKPVNSVTVRFDTNDSTEGTVSVTSLVFDGSTWNVPQSVTVYGVDDTIIDGPKGYSIVFQTTQSSDPQYGGTTPAPDVGMTNADNDAAGYVVSAISGHTTEAAGTATFTIHLLAEPSADVTVRFDSDTPAEGTIATTFRVFTTLDWESNKTVTVTGVNDDVDDGDITYHIVFQTSQSADTNYAGTTPSSVTVVNDDNDTFGYTVSTMSTNTTEAGGTATFTVKLNTQPTAPVTVNFHSGDTTEAQPGVASLVFNAGNWSSTQSVTVTGQDDPLVDNDQAFSIVFDNSDSADTKYNGTKPSGNVAGTNWDNECVLINEIVTDPQLDWNDSAGGTTPFNKSPGTGTVDSNDEWIELTNICSRAMDITGYDLVMDDATIYTYTFGTTSQGQTLVFMGGGSLTAFGGGEYLVLGTPSGNLGNSMDDDIYIHLDNASDVLVDGVALGSSLGGDSDTSNNAPSGDSSDIAHETVGRMPNAFDSNDDKADFEHLESTFGSDNSCTNKATNGFDASSSTQGAAVDKLTWSHTTTAAQTERLLVVGVTIKQSAGETVTGITYDTTFSLTKISAVDGTGMRVELWYLRNPLSGTKDIVVTFSSATTTAAAGALTYYGIRQTLPLAGGATATGNDNTATVAFTNGQSSARVVDVMAYDATGGNAVVGLGQTQRWGEDIPSGTPTLNCRGSGKGPAAAGSTTMSWALTSSANWATAAQAFAPGCR